MSGFVFDSQVAQLAQTKEKSALDVFNETVASGTQAFVNLIGARNQIQSALKTGEQSPTQNTPQTATQNGGVPGWLILAVVVVVAVKVLK